MRLFWGDMAGCFDLVEVPGLNFSLSEKRSDFGIKEKSR
jgi:hypothetical protein